MTENKVSHWQSLEYQSYCPFFIFLSLWSFPSSLFYPLHSFYYAGPNMFRCCYSHQLNAPYWAECPLDCASGQYDCLLQSISTQHTCLFIVEFVYCMDWQSQYLYVTFGNWQVPLPLCEVVLFDIFRNWLKLKYHIYDCSRVSVKFIKNALITYNFFFSPQQLGIMLFIIEGNFSRLVLYVNIQAFQLSNFVNGIYKPSSDCPDSLCVT